MEIGSAVRLQGKIWLSAGAVIASLMALDLWMGYRGIESDLRDRLDSEARIVRAALMATRRVYHQQFLASGLPITEQTIGFLPAHAMSECHAQFPEWLDTGLRFNNVSDRPRNPANQADTAELEAMAWFRNNPKASERVSEFRDAQGHNIYHFTAPIWIEPYCLGCHGNRNDAPPSIRDHYANAYGYKLGDLRGVMSIKLPLDDLRNKALHQWHREFGLRAAGYLVLLILLGTLLQRLVIRPVRELARVARQLSEGDLSARASVNTGLSGNDEIAQLAERFNTMAGAIAEHDAQVARLNRLYSALSETNQTIVRINEEYELMKRICRIAVDLGGMAMAWIGGPDAAGKRMVVRESHGNGLGFLSSQTIPLSGAGEEASTPPVAAYRSNRPVIVQDLLADERTRPWQEAARSFGWASCAAYPIVRGKKVQLVLNLVHGESHAFDQRIQDLLEEMAMDIGYALDRIDLVSEQNRINAQLKASEAKYRSVLETSQDGFWMLDRLGHLIEVNDAYVAFSGYSREELLGMTVADLDATETASETGRHVHQVFASGSDVFETRHRTRSGAIKPVEISTSVTSITDGYLSVFIRDLSNRQEAAERIQRLSHFDSLTGLPNLTLFTDLFRQAIGQAARNGESLAMVFVDIDHFKHINDTLGHRVGDLLLIELTERFQSALRTEDTLSRLGGDEFLLLLPHADAQDAAHVAERLLAACSRPMTIEEHQLLATPSLGIALYPSDGEDFETLLRKADTATNRAKEEGRNGYRFFTDEMQQRSARTLHLEAALRLAQERNQLRLHFQPQVDLKDGRIVGIEALIRWQHPELGLISPAEFIPIAENSGLILPIGEWVLRTALTQLRSLIDQKLPVPLVAVNLSAVQFRQTNLPARVAEILGEIGLPPGCLELELTESLTMENPVTAVAMMDTLHQQGIKLSIDDFGTGYSSLNYLKRFRIDKLKIDQSFVRDLTHDPEGEAIVQAIVKLASTLKFRTIAEGVETVEQLRFLRDCDCEEVQGYYFSRPLPPEQLVEWLRNWNPARVRE